MIYLIDRLLFLYILIVLKCSTHFKLRNSSSKRKNKKYLYIIKMAVNCRNYGIGKQRKYRPPN